MAAAPVANWHSRVGVSENGESVNKHGINDKNHQFGVKIKKRFILSVVLHKCETWTRQSTMAKRLKAVNHV